MLSHRRAAQTDIRAEVEHLREALQPVRRRAAFQVAERAYSALRRQKTDLTEQLRLASQEAWAAGASAATPRMRKLDADLAALETRLAEAKSTLDEERAQHAAAVLAAIGPQLTVAAGVLADVLGLLDQAVQPLVELDRMAQAQRLDAARTRLLASSPQLLELAHQGRRILNRASS